MKRTAWIKLLVWLAALSPLARLIFEFLTDRLGANPIERITHQTGWWALTLLMVTLAITPLRRLTGWNSLIKFRRLTGLFAFFYVCLHFSTYLVLDHFFYWETIIEDIVERPFITVGFAAFLMLIPLAVTSTKGWIRRLGRRWAILHRLIYLAAALGTLHFFWKVKADTREPLIFIAILAVLLLVRLPFARRRAQRRPLGGRAPAVDPARSTS